MSALALVLLAGAVAGAPAPAAELPIRRFALVVGYNEPPSKGAAPLRYGDDDAVRWTVLLQTFGADVALLTRLDDESRQLYGAAVPTLAAPTRAGIAAAMIRIAAGVKAARATGARTVFYFVYAGHGDVENGQGFAALEGGRLYRDDLETMVIGGSGADTNHIVVDACRSYYLVYDRGPGGSRRPWNTPYFAAGVAARFPNTGVLLASSSEAPTHEWEEFQAGVFSHEVRSAVLGAADLDRNGRISYQEISAFVRVANRPIRNARYRPAFFARAPAGKDDFMDLGAATGGVMNAGARPSARYLLEDQMGVRWADLHPDAAHEVSLRLPRAGWAPGHFFFRAAGAREEYRVPAGETVSLARLTTQPAAALPRGAAHEAFSQLFAEPFGVRALAEPGAGEPLALAATAPPVDLGLRPLRLASFVAGGVGIAALGGAGALTWLGTRERDRAADAARSGDERARANQRLDRLGTWRAVTGLAGAALLLGGVGLYLGDRHLAPSLAVVPLEGGGLALLTRPLW